MNLRILHLALFHIAANLLVCATFPQSLLSQQTDIRGTITDSTNGERIAFATVLIEGTSNGSATNSSGFFLIPNVPPGSYTLRVSCVGYHVRTKSIVAANSGPILVNVALIPEPVKGPETVVVGKKGAELSPNQTSIHTMDENDLQAVPVAAVPDVFRAIQILPGIVSTSDVDSHFYVRGGGGDQNLILLNGIKMYNPFHALSIFSIFDPDIIRTTEVYTGAFPPGYGGRLSSVVSLTTKDGNANRIGGKAGLNFISSKLQLEGPLGDNYTWLADARKSFSNTTINRFLQKNLPASFYDAFFKITTRTENDANLRFGLQGFFSGDNLRSNDPFQPDYSWRNHMIGFTTDGLILQRVFVDAVAYETYFEAKRNPNNSVTTTPASTSIREMGVRANVTVFMDSKDLLYFGFEMSFPDIHNSLVNSLRALSETDDFAVDGWLWLRYQTSFGPWHCDGGIHMDAITLMSQGGVEDIQPRLNVSRALFGNWKVKASYGQFTQKTITINNEDDVVSVFDTWIRIPEGLKAEQAIHYVLGVDGNIVPGLAMSLQGYFKDYRSLVVYNRDKVDFLDPDYINAAGKSYGLELLYRYGVPVADLYAAYSWSRASITSRGIMYPPKYDRQHCINLLCDVHMVENVDLTLRWEYGSGLPFSQTIGYYDKLSLQDFYLNAFAFGIGNPAISLGSKNGARLPSYQRMDVGLTYLFRVGSLKGRAGINVINVYDRHNIFYVDRTTGKQVDMLPFLPSATIELEY